MKIIHTERICAGCGASYSPNLAKGGRLPRGYKVCPHCGGRSTEFTSRLYECGCCGGYHRATFFGDCRCDSERFHYGMNTLDGKGERA